MMTIRIVLGRVGKGVRADAVPRHLHEGGARTEDQAQRGQDSGGTSSISTVYLRNTYYTAFHRGNPDWRNFRPIID